MTDPAPLPASRASTLPRVLEPEAMDTDDEARDYDAMDHAAVNARFADDALAAGADLSRALDVGTGTAQIPIALCGRDASARVLAVDLSDAMLAVARRNVERAGLAGVVALHRVDGKALGFRDGRFSAVVSNSIVHHVPEPATALAEMLRVLAPGGLLFVRDLARPVDDAAVAARVARYAAGANAHQRALFDASLRAALTLDEVTALAASFGVPASAVTASSDRHWTLAHRKP